MLFKLTSEQLQQVIESAFCAGYACNREKVTATGKRSKLGKFERVDVADKERRLAAVRGRVTALTGQKL